MRTENTLKDLKHIARILMQKGELGAYLKALLMMQTIEKHNGLIS